jgi:raffinose/stachyose/melibiose transport system substrate-binding protein
VAWESAETAGFNAVAKLFEKENPGVKISATFADVNPHQALVRTELSAGTAPDIVQVSAANGNPIALDQLVPPGYLANLSDQAWLNDIPQSIRWATQVDGKTYMLPTTIYGIGMMFNMNTMHSIGASPPTTYSQVLALCKTAEAHGKYAFDISVGGIQAIMVPYALVATNVYSTDPNFDVQQKAGKTSFAASPGYLKSLEQEQQMNTAGCFGPRPSGEVLTDSVNNVANGHALGSITITALTGQYIAAAPHATFEFFPLPSTDNPAQTRVDAGAGNGAAINASAKNLPLAKKFLAFLATPAAQALYSKVNGELPAMPGPAYQYQPIVQNLITLFDANRTGPLLDQNWPNAVVQQTLVQGVQNMFAGNAAPMQVLRNMDQSYASNSS